MQFINYVYRVKSTQQLFVVTPALFRRLLHTYIDYIYTLKKYGTANIEV